ncbi:MAG: EAL domain-containing response regulator [Gammaproteobacteria bacterium]|nr:EAL domain-containing response regulator [Gammaproteobacteria bacterium]MCF6231043.1 EAL domain-containing response regulator [Gammaproteobacteria bacterium]
MKPKLYILDDDSQYANLLLELAKRSGWSAVSEQSASRFLDYDLSAGGILVLDLNMPEMDGIEVIRALAKEKKRLVLILISGFDARVLHSARQLAEAHDIKVLASLTKPVVRKEFIKALESVAGGERAEISPVSHNEPVTAQELTEAILQRQLVLHFQPQVTIETEALLGVEALVRWQHPDRGLIFPGDFIPLAEKEGLIDRLTEVVIILAVEQSRRWQSEGLDVVISVNVSAENIKSLSLPEQLKELTDKHAIEPGKIELEITESAFMGELTSSLDVLNRLRMKGFSLSIDDFGTGYSSLTQLYQAPFTELKIDQRFIMRMIEDKEAMVIVKICIMLGHMLGMRLVAEGVETREIWDELKKLGCDVAQGYFIAKPMPAEALITWSRCRSKI